MEFRRTLGSQARAQRDKQEVVFRQDFSRSLFTVNRGGQVTLNIPAVRDAIGVRAQTADIDLSGLEVETFSGAGTTGLVPDPGTETGAFLRDDGTWVSIPGGGDMLKSVYDTDDDGIVDFAEALDHLIANTELDVMAAETIKGNDGLLPSQPQDLTRDEVRTILDASTKFGSDRIPISDVVTGRIDREWLEIGGPASMLRTPVPPDSAEWFEIPDHGVPARVGTASSQITSLQLRPNSVFIRQNDDLIDFQMSNNAVLAKRGANPLDEVVFPTQSILLRQDGALLSSQSPEKNRWFGASAQAGTNIFWRTMARLKESLIDADADSGTAFPSDSFLPLSGYRFYREDLSFLFAYDDKANANTGEYLSVAEFDIAGHGSNESSYLDWSDAGGITFASNVGPSFPFDVQPVWCQAYVGSNSTATFVVRDDGVDVASATLTYVSQSGSLALSWFENIEPPIIAAGSIVSLAVTAGMANGNVFFKVYFRRVES